MNTFLRQLGLAARIWLVAAGINAVLFTFVIVFINTAGALGILFLCAIMSAVFSIPCLVVVLCIIRLLATVVSGKFLFGCIMAGGLITTVFVLIGIAGYMGEGDKGIMFYMWITGLIAAIGGVAASYKSILQWGREVCHFEKI